jgi:hypothetical protein
MQAWRKYVCLVFVFSCLCSKVVSMLLIKNAHLDTHEHAVFLVSSRISWRRATHGGWGSKPIAHVPWEREEGSRMGGSEDSSANKHQDYWQENFSRRWLLNVGYRTLAVVRRMFGEQDGLTSPRGSDVSPLSFAVEAWTKPKMPYKDALCTVKG